MSRRVRVEFLIAGICALCAASASAQRRVTTADLTGVVFDQTRAVLPGATLTVTNVATNLERTAGTDVTGRFSVPALPPGTYRVTVEASGFATQLRENVSLVLGSVVDLEFTLTLSGVAQTVTVEAEAPLVDARRTVVSTVISEHQIDSLPINGRDFLSFSLLTPGVASDRTPQQGSSATSGLTFAGQRARSNNIMVDGLDNNDTAAGSARAVFSQEAVREFQVLASSSSAEFGKASGGVLNIVTRSGTNQVSGSAFAFLRDERLNAKEYFERLSPAGDPIDRDKAAYGQTQLGATLGGPLRRDRTFYFLSFERLEVEANNFVNINDRDVISVFGSPAGTPADILRKAGFPVETGDVPYRVESSQLLGKIDHQLSPARTLAVRVNWAGVLNENIEPWGGLVARSRGAMLDSNDVMLAVSYSSVTSAKAVNEIRAQVAYRDERVLSLDPACGGRCDREDQGGPTLEVIGVASVGRQRFTPVPRETLRYQLLDTFSFERRNHILKLGADYNYISHLAGALPLHFGGRYIFAPLPAIPGLLPAPISSIQALALGLPAAYVQGYGNAAARYAVHDLAVFIQDEWPLSPDLTLKLGLRYQNQLWPAFRYEVRGVGSYSFPADHDNIAPRVAAAWNPRSNRQLSVHAAYGVFHDVQLTSLAGIADIVDGTAGGVRTLVLPFPGAAGAWTAPGRRLPESAVGSYPSLAITIDPRLKTPYAHHATVGITRQLPGRISLAGAFLHVRGRDQVGTIDYNPLVPELGPGRRPEDDVRDGVPVPGTSASILQYTTFGQTWYRGLIVSLSKRFDGRSQLLASYTISKAEDNSTDYQSAFVPQDMGNGRDRRKPFGLPLGFDPATERGPSLQDQRHRVAVSGLYVMPANVHVSSIVTLASGRPYNVLAGADLNGDGNGGAFPPDRARRLPGDSASSVSRNSATLPMQAAIDVRISRRFPLKGRASIDGIFEMFNLFNRTNFVEINNIFGTGAFPSDPLPTFGQFEKTGPPRQAQVAVKVNF